MIRVSPQRGGYSTRRLQEIASYWSLAEIRHSNSLLILELSALFEAQKKTA